jgi:hypothetical protein
MSVIWVGTPSVSKVVLDNVLPFGAIGRCSCTGVLLRRSRVTTQMAPAVVAKAEESALVRRREFLRATLPRAAGEK